MADEIWGQLTTYEPLDYDLEIEEDVEASEPDEIWGSLSDTSIDFGDEYELPTPPEEQDSVLKDVWDVGKHRLNALKDIELHIFKDEFDEETIAILKDAFIRSGDRYAGSEESRQLEEKFARIGAAFNELDDTDAGFLEDVEVIWEALKKDWDAVLFETGAAGIESSPIMGITAAASAIPIPFSGSIAQFLAQGAFSVYETMSELVLEETNGDPDQIEALLRDKEKVRDLLTRAEKGGVAQAGAETGFSLLMSRIPLAGQMYRKMNKARKRWQKSARKVEDLKKYKEGIAEAQAIATKITPGSTARRGLAIAGGETVVSEPGGDIARQLGAGYEEVSLGEAALEGVVGAGSGATQAVADVALSREGIKTKAVIEAQLEGMQKKVENDIAIREGRTPPHQVEADLNQLEEGNVEGEAEATAKEIVDAEEKAAEAHMEIEPAVEEPVTEDIETADLPLSPPTAESIAATAKKIDALAGVTAEMVDAAVADRKGGKQLTEWIKAAGIEKVPFRKAARAELLHLLIGNKTSTDAEVQAAGAAAEEVTGNLTKEQRENEEYDKPQVTVGGMVLNVETNKDQVRTGKNEDGTEWSQKMPYIVAEVDHIVDPETGEKINVIGKDGDKFDVNIGPNPNAPNVYVIHQQNKDGTEFDEHKAMAGFDSEKEAVEAYKSGYDFDPNIESVVAFTTEEFQQKLQELPETPETAVEETPAQEEAQPEVAATPQAKPEEGQETAPAKPEAEKKAKGMQRHYDKLEEIKKDNEGTLAEEITDDINEVMDETAPQRTEPANLRQQRKGLQDIWDKNPETVADVVDDTDKTDATKGYYAKLNDGYVTEDGVPVVYGKTIKELRERLASTVQTKEEYDAAQARESKAETEGEANEREAKEYIAKKKEEAIKHKISKLQQVINAMGLRRYIEVVANPQAIGYSESITSRGMFIPQKDGSSKLYVFANRVRSTEEGIVVAIHEAIGHAEMREIIGAKDFNKVLDAIWYDHVEYITRVGKALGHDVNTLAGRRVATEEYLAIAAQNALDRHGKLWIMDAKTGKRRAVSPALIRVKALIRKVLRNLGLDMRRWGDVEILELIVKANKLARSNRPVKKEVFNAAQRKPRSSRRYGGRTIRDDVPRAITPEHVFYHASDKKFDRFQTGLPAERYRGGETVEVESQGVFLGTSPKEVEGYGKHVTEHSVDVKKLLTPLDDSTMIDEDDWGAEQSRITKLDDYEYIFEPLIDDDGYINLMDDYVVNTNTSLSWVTDLTRLGVHWAAFDNPEVVERMVERGYDSAIVIEPEGVSGESLFVVDPNNVYPAGEAPERNLRSGLTEERINMLIRDWGVDKHGLHAVVVDMKAEDYLRATTASQEGPAIIREEVTEGRDGRTGDNPQEYEYGRFDPDRYIYNELSWLRVDAQGVILEHDGRHRIAILGMRGVDTIPVVLRLDPPEQVLSESRLPENGMLGGQQWGESAEYSGDDISYTGLVQVREENRQQLIDKYEGADVRYSDVREDDLFVDEGGFYSKLDLEVGKLPFEEATAEIWWQHISKLTQKGVKRSEVEWIGIEDWLKEEGKKGEPISKEQVQFVIRLNSPNFVTHIYHTDAEGKSLGGDPNSTGPIPQYGGVEPKWLFSELWELQGVDELFVEDDHEWFTLDWDKRSATVFKTRAEVVEHADKTGEPAYYIPANGYMHWEFRGIDTFETAMKDPTTGTSVFTIQRQREGRYELTDHVRGTVRSYPTLTDAAIAAEDTNVPLTNIDWDMFPNANWDEFVDDHDRVISETRFMEHRSGGPIDGNYELYVTLPGHSFNSGEHSYGDPEVDTGRLFHVRMTVRTINNKRTLVIEEIQSDLHQRGARAGYDGPRTLKANEGLVEEKIALRKESRKILRGANASTPQTKIGLQMLARGVTAKLRADAINHLTKQFSLTRKQKAVLNRYAVASAKVQRLENQKRMAAWVEEAPLAGPANWLMAGFRRALKLAVDEGFEQIAWNSGDTVHGIWPSANARKGFIQLYDEILPREVEKFVTKLGGKAPKRADTFNPNGALELVIDASTDRDSDMVVTLDPDAVWAVDVSNQMQEYAETGVERFSTQLPDEDFPGLAQKIKETEGTLPRIFDPWRFQMQDKLIDGKRVIGAVGERNITEDMNFYMKASLWDSKAGEGQVEFRKKFTEPLRELAALSKLPIEEIGRWLVARHADEANRLLYARNEKMSQDPERAPDRARLSGMESAFTRLMNGGTEKTEAELLLEQYRDNTILRRIGELVDQLNSESLDMMVEKGLIAAGQAEQWRRMYNHYVPLFRSEAMSELSLPRRGQGFHVTGKESYHRTGSAELKPDMILINTLLQAENRIIRAEKNEVAKAMYNFVLEYEDPDFWTIVENKTRPTLVNGQVQQMPVMTHDDYELSMKVDGEIRTIRFNRDNDRAKRLVSGMKNLQSPEFGPIIKGLSFVTRNLSMLNTSLNPEFVITNFFRDYQTAGYNLTNTELKSHITKVMLSVPKAANGIRNALFGDGKSEWAGYWQDFVEHGGKTMWIDSHKDPAVAEAQLKKEIADLNKGNLSTAGLKRLGKWMMTGIDNANAVAENAARLSAFKHASTPVEQGGLGLSKERAAYIAKELTVNFNRKGNMGPTMNALYMFYNASIQGQVRLLQAMTQSRKGQVLALSTVGFAIGLDILNRMQAPDDDDGENLYDALPDYVKAHNLIIWDFMGTSEDKTQPQIKIPLPWGYNVLHVIGQAGGEQYDGVRSPLESASHVLDSAIGAFNPLGASTPAQTMTPTVLDPFTQIWENKTYSGLPLMPEQMNTGPTDTPNYRMHFRSATETSKVVTKWLNDLDGNSQRPGFINLSPEWLDNLGSFVTGGVGRFFGNTLDTGIRLQEGLSEGKPLTEVWEDIPTRRIPIWRKIHGFDPEYGVQSRYYKWSADVAYAEKEMKYLKGAARREARNDPSVRAIPAYKTSDKNLRALRKQRRELVAKSASQDRLDRIDAKIRREMVRFNKRYIRLVLESDK